MGWFNHQLDEDGKLQILTSPAYGSINIEATYKSPRLFVSLFLFPLSRVETF